MTHPVPFRRGQNGQFGNALTDIVGRQAFASIFGELVTASRSDDISVQFQYNNSDNDLVIVAPTGTGFESNANSMMRVGTGAGIGGQTVFSKDAIRYRPGHEAYSQFTARFEGADVGVNQMVGIGNGDDRICFGTKDGVLGRWFQEGGNPPIFTPRASFKGDTLDGSGEDSNPSGFDWQADKSIIFYPVYGWLGIAPIIWLVFGGFELGWIVADWQDETNIATEPHLQNPSLPMVCESIRTAGTGDAFIETSSWRAGSVGGQEEDNASNRGFADFALNYSASQTLNVHRHLFTLRSKTAFQGKTNHVRAKVEILRSISAANKDTVIAAVPTAILRSKDPVFAAALDADYTDANTANSVMEVADINATISAALSKSEIADLVVLPALDTAVNLDILRFFIYPAGEISFIQLSDGTAINGTVSQQINWTEEF
jgi:hypothetical protein